MGNNTVTYTTGCSEFIRRLKQQSNGGRELFTYWTRHRLSDDAVKRISLIEKHGGYIVENGEILKRGKISIESLFSDTRVGGIDNLCLPTTYLETEDFLFLVNDSFSGGSLSVNEDIGYIQFRLSKTIDSQLVIDYPNINGIITSSNT